MFAIVKHSIKCCFLFGNILLTTRNTEKRVAQVNSRRWTLQFPVNNFPKQQKSQTKTKTKQNNDQKFQQSNNNKKLLNMAK